MSTKKFQSAPGWALAHRTMSYEALNDAAIYQADMQMASVTAYKDDNGERPARVSFNVHVAGFELSSCMTPACARKLAVALVKAADICEQFESQQAEVES